MINLTKEKNEVKKLFEKLNLENVNKIERIPSSQNYVFKVEIDSNVYVVKRFSKDAIRNRYDLEKKKKQIKFSKELARKNIKVILPISFKGKEFICYNGNYYLIYNYYNYKTFEKDELTLKQIKKLGETLAKIHKINSKIDLPNRYQKIEIDLDKYIKIYKSTNAKVAKYITLNKNKLDEMIKNHNENIKFAKKHLCVSHNDFKALNMMWSKDDVYLLDFDAAGLVNPTAAMIEAAFSLNRNGLILKEKYVKEFIKTYTSILPVKSEEFKVALEVAMGGKLRWFRYILDRGLEEKEYQKDVIRMIDEFMLYEKWKEECTI